MKNNKTQSANPLKKTKGSKKYAVILTGNTLNCHENILVYLHKERNLKEVSAAKDCDIILVFCPIVSRAGTDIEAALKKLNEFDPENSKPAIFLVLHHTFDSDSIVADSRHAVGRDKTLSVDILFHEDQGLLQCSKNNVSLKNVSKSLKWSGIKKLEASKGKGQQREKEPHTDVSTGDN